MNPDPSPGIPDGRQGERNALVDSFLRDPRSRVQDPRVVAVMREVPRHRFVPPDLQAFAYDDRPLPIGSGQTISQPSLVAYMTQELKVRPSDRVLEIGTGSGYQAAILSRLVREVYSVEIIASLAETAAKVLADLGYDNVRIRCGDGHAGWADASPFDAILVACAPEAVPAPLAEQLREGGRMVVPVGPQSDPQELLFLEKRDGQLKRQGTLPVRFVPMTGGNGIE